MTVGEREVVMVLGGTSLAAVVVYLLSALPTRRTVRNAGAWTALAMLVAFTCYGTVALCKLSAHNMGSEDLGRVDQAVWSVLDGRLLVFSASEIGREMSRLAGHVELLYVPLAPLYLLWDSAGALVLAQCAIATLGAWPALRIGRRLGGDGLGLAAALAYLGHPAFGSAVLADVHGDTLAMPLLLLALERGLAGRRLACFMAMALAVSAKEYVAALAVTVGLYLWWRNGDRRLAAACVGLGLVWVLLVVPAFHDHYRPDDFPVLTPLYYEDLGSTPGEVIETGLTEPLRLARRLLTPRKLGTTALLLAPFAFLSLLAPEVLLLAMPVYIPLAVTEHLDWRNHHNATLLPFLLVAALIGGRRLASSGRIAAVIAGAVAVVHITVAPSPLSVRSWSPGRWDYYPNPHIAGRTDHDDILELALATIPDDARVSVSGHLMPQLSHRRVCFTFPAPPDAAAIDRFVVDLVDAFPPPYRPRSSELTRMRQLLDDGLHIQLARDGVFVLGREPRPAPPASPPPPPPAAPFRLGPTLVRPTAAGLEVELLTPLPGPYLLLDVDSRDVLAVEGLPPAVLPASHDPRRRRRLRLLVLHEGFPALDPREPPQPWLPDPYVAERLCDLRR